MNSKKSINWNILLKLILAITSAICTGIALNEMCIWALILFSITTLYFCYVIYNNKNINASLINTLLEAIKNNDYSFRFKNAKSGYRDKIVYDALNKITELLKQEKQNIIKREKYYELIINSIKTAIIVVNENGNVVQTNDEALSLFKLHVLTHISQFNSVDKNIENVFISLQSGQRQHISINVESQELHLFIRVSQLEAHGGIVKVFTINDIRTEIDRNELDSWIKITRVLTHEIMNGIAPISSLSESLLQHNDVIDNKHINNALTIINGTSHSLLNFVESYRKFASIPTPSPSLIYIKDLLSNATEVAESYLKDINLTLDINPKDMILYADNALITQVILNLLKNASQAFNNTIIKPQIKIKSYCSKDESVIIEISNNGPAISQELAEQVFVPFITTKVDGSGIGLSVSKQIMVLSSGNLTLRCDHNKEFATTFILTFN